MFSDVGSILAEERKSMSKAVLRDAHFISSLRKKRGKTGKAYRSLNRDRVPSSCNDALML